MSFPNGLQLCLGLDLHKEDLPSFFAKQLQEDPVFFGYQWGQSIGKGLANVSKEISPTFKIQSAFFEALGPRGFDSLRALIQSLRSSSSCFIILDAKRCDIGSSFAAYFSAAFHELEVDAMTAIPYMGVEAGMNLLGPRQKLIYVLASSNIAEATWQKKMALDIASALKEAQNRFRVSPQGIVVGAQAFEHFSSEVIKDWVDSFDLLIPGIGAQGGTITTEKMGFLSSSKNRVWISSSRSLSPFYQNESKEKIESWEIFTDRLKEQLHKQNQFKTLS